MTKDDILSKLATSKVQADQNLGAKTWDEISKTTYEFY